MSMPDKFRCVITNWDHVYNLCRNIANDVNISGYKPDTVIALARGGWVAGRVVCDFLGINDLVSLKIEHYTGTAIAGAEPIIRYPITTDAISGKKVLIIDDIADTGKSIIYSNNYINTHNPKETRTAVLQYLTTSSIKPDYCGEVLTEFGWIIYPWNFMEDMIDISTRIIKREDMTNFKQSELDMKLSSYHNINQFERIHEVLEEMKRRGIVNYKEGKWSKL